MCKTDNQWEFIWIKELKPVLRNKLGGWEGVGGGREIEGGGDTCIPVTDSCWCIVEANTILWSNFPSIKNE